MTDNGYEVVLCDTEADIRIASECQAEDIVMSRDSDFFAYPAVRTI